MTPCDDSCFDRAGVDLSVVRCLVLSRPWSLGELMDNASKVVSLRGEQEVIGRDQ